jgi:hypothetical protein
LPANAGTISTYLAGTTTPAATYTTSSGSVANSQPIVLTPAGLAPFEIWLSQGIAYKFIVADSLGNQIGPTYDNLTGIGDGTILAGTSAIPVNAQTGTTYTAQLTDAPLSACCQGTITMNNGSANTLTIPPHSSVAWVVGTLLQVIQIGAGQTTIAAGIGVTINDASTLKCRVQYSVIFVTNIATDSWIVAGDMA